VAPLPENQKNYFKRRKKLCHATNVHPRTAGQPHARPTTRLPTEVQRVRPVTYTVSYNANGGNGAPGSQTKTHGATLTLSNTVPSRAGYTFLGWATSSTVTSVSYQPGGLYTANAGIILYAVWDVSATEIKIIIE